MYCIHFYFFLLFLQSKRETMVFYPTDPAEKYGLFALRLGKYKAHFYTQGTADFIYIISWNVKKHYHTVRTYVFVTPACPCLCIRCYPQRYYPGPRLPSICSPQGPRPSSYFRPGGWPLGALPSAPDGKTRPPSPVGEDQESQGAVWSLHGVWRKPDIKRNRPRPGALLQSSV